MSNLFANAANLTSAAVNIGNSIGRDYNNYRAVMETDPEQRALFNARALCSSKLYLEKVRTTFLSIIFPILLLILMIYIDDRYKVSTTNKNYSYVYFGIGIWFILGLINVTFIKAYYSWPKRQYDINMAKK